MERDLLSTNRKALSINLDPSIYGTVAEIGGGQEVARQFFQAGGASGTIAKSISAYDKLFSDKLYNQNKPGKYVSEARLCTMLDAEFNDLVGLLTENREIQTRFFAFANTVALCKKVGFERAFIAIYSPRPGTAAAHLKDNVPHPEKRRRWRILEKLVNQKN